MGLVAFVFASVLMLAEGLKNTLVATGSEDNVVILRQASESEVQSAIERDQANIIESSPEIALSRNGSRLVARELVVLITLPKRGTDKPANVVVRGVSPESLAIRPQIQITAGRLFRFGSREIIVGSGIAKRFQGARLGETLRFALRDWQVVGIFDTGNTGFDSEVWGDREQLMQAFRRPVYSSLILKLRDPSEFNPLKQRLEADPRLTVEAKLETQYYAEQSEMMARFIRILGIVLTIIFSFGAMIGAMVTMYAAVANRTVEIGTLQALGFKRYHLLTALLIEALLLGLFGGLLGLFVAYFMQFISVSTTNWQTFSELAFSFALSGKIISLTLIFALVMGFVGGFLPSVRAARINIVEALRTS
jgi:ABC-type lipoprotein release transport system permease subunit